jgi:hypothetical protein
MEKQWSATSILLIYSICVSTLPSQCSYDFCELRTCMNYMSHSRLPYSSTVRNHIPSIALLASRGRPNSTGPARVTTSGRRRLRVSSPQPVPTPANLICHTLLYTAQSRYVFFGTRLALSYSR